MKKLLLGAVFSAAASAAIAADVPAPVYKAPPAIVSTSGLYFSVDGAWERVNLPDYALGFRQVGPGPVVFNDLGPFQSFRQRFDGFQVRAAAGYFLPPAASNTLFGANSRLEIGGLYSRASGTATGTALFTGGGVVTQTLDGAGAINGWLCSAATNCTANSNLSTDYSRWQLHGKIAGDYRSGAILLTPSLAVFGGEAHTNNSLAQILQIGAAVSRPTYNASTSLRWTDVGARAGLDLKVDVTPRVAVGLGGWAGFAGRRASLSGTDVATDPLGGLMVGASTISTGANATPFVANAEAGVAFKVLPAFIVRGFVGLNHDSSVPGIASPSFTGPLFAVTSRTPASISFHSETSYYAGGGITWALGPVFP